MIWNIPALGAKGLHRGKLNTKVRFAFVITEETKDLTAPKFHRSEFTLSWRKTLPVNRQLREHILPWTLMFMKTSLISTYSYEHSFSWRISDNLHERTLPWAHTFINAHFYEHTSMNTDFHDPGLTLYFHEQRLPPIHVFMSTHLSVAHTSMNTRFSWRFFHKHTISCARWKQFHGHTNEHTLITFDEQWLNRHFSWIKTSISAYLKSAHFQEHTFHENHISMDTPVHEHTSSCRQFQNNNFLEHTFSWTLTSFSNAPNSTHLHVFWQYTFPWVHTYVNTHVDGHSLSWKHPSMRTHSSQHQSHQTKRLNTAILYHKGLASICVQLPPV